MRTVSPSLTDIGVALPGAANPLRALDRTHGRLTVIRLHRTMEAPAVTVHSLWSDNDTRNTGRVIRVVEVRNDGRVVVETVRPGARRFATKATVGTILTLVSLARFRGTTRGFSPFDGRLAPKDPDAHLAHVRIRPESPRTPASIGVASRPHTTPTQPPLSADPAPTATTAPTGPWATTDNRTPVVTLAALLADGNVTEESARAAAALIALVGREAATATAEANPHLGSTLRQHGVPAYLRALAAIFTTNAKA